MYVVQPTYDLKVKEPLLNAPLLEKENCLKQNSFLHKDFLKLLRSSIDFGATLADLHLNDLRKLASEQGIGTKRKSKNWLVRELLKLTELKWYWASKPEFRLLKGEKYYTMVLTWNNYPKNWFVRVLATGVSEYVLNPKSGKKTGTPYIQGLIRFQYQQRPSALMKQLEGIHLEARRVRLEKPGSIKACCKFCSKLSIRDGETYIKGFDKYFQPFEGKVSKLHLDRELRKVLVLAKITEKEYQDYVVDYDYITMCTCEPWNDIECQGCIDSLHYGNMFYKGCCELKGWKTTFYPLTEKQRGEQLRKDDEEEEKASSAYQRALQRWRKRNRFPKK
uniref:Uncharacterized protein n=1 Tax=Pithovirus LCPAC304 TaxID=2506594 RepID=A0A481Z7X2_9VIRU|nr:MAG: hypothetical protein LCPAC304_01960 [Pithovirus LCPAC304]